VGGRAKGHHLQGPRGSETRPTSDKVRESVFNILRGEFTDSAVLDLFAGTGALGIEALSQGASDAVFVERSAAACAVIRANLRRIGFEDAGRVMQMPAEKALRTISDSFGLVMLDPPYAYPGIHDILSLIGNSRVVDAESIVVLEHSPRFPVNERYSKLTLERHKVYGDTAVSIFAVQEEVYS
jgi:16S rRNA (guanine(966)-N(2))-methyltransferase RsmD